MAYAKAKIDKMKKLCKGDIVVIHASPEGHHAHLEGCIAEVIGDAKDNTLIDVLCQSEIYDRQYPRMLFRDLLEVIEPARTEDQEKTLSGLQDLIDKIKDLEKALANCLEKLCNQ